MTEQEHITFIKGDPGAVRHGNFINYYSFHSATQRSQNLCPQMFPNDLSESGVLCCLDIGCNTGELTEELYAYLKQLFPRNIVNILGIDIDENLIKRAISSNNNPNITYKHLDIMNKTGNFLKEYLTVNKKSCFDVSFCFSVTMWIHLNNGDAGLVNFLSSLKHYSNTIVIEPQPWHCYRNAQRRLTRNGDEFPHYPHLSIRSNVDKFIENTLSQQPFIKLYESERSKWRRRISSFTNTSLTTH